MSGGEGGALFRNNMDDFYHADTEKIWIADPKTIQENKPKSDLTIYLKVTSILFVRAGLFLSQVSSIPSSNIQILIFQNILDIAINTVIYSLIGFLFAFGKDVGSFIGLEGFLGDSSNRNDFVEGWLIVIAVSGLLVAAIGDRVSFFASLLLNTFISALVLPLFIHWTMTDYGWMKRYEFASLKVSYKDYSYSCLIHMAGGFLALISMLVLNRRLLRFKDMDVCSIPDNGPSLTLFGNFFMIIGFFGIGIPTKKYFLSHLDFDFYGIVMANMLLSAFGAVTSTFLLTFSCPCEPMHKWTSMRSIQAGISGIAVIAGGADVYYPMAALVIGLCNGFIFFLVSFLVNISPIEDYSNITACHFVSGFIGTLLPPVFGVREGFNSSAYYCIVHMTWQFLCDLAILASIIAVFSPLTFLLDFCSILRSWDEDINHRRALFASKTIKNTHDDSNAYSWPDPNPNVACEEEEFRDKTSQEEEVRRNEEKVDVLFESRQCPTVSFQEKREEAPSGDFSKNERYLVNYMVHSKPMTFFEELSDSRQTSDVVVKECGDHTTKNSRFFDIRLIKGIRNISDSKLFHKFKDNWTMPKKRAIWSRDRELRFGSASNIWGPVGAGQTLETQV